MSTQLQNNYPNIFSNKEPDIEDIVDENKEQPIVQQWVKFFISNQKINPRTRELETNRRFKINVKKAVIYSTYIKNFRDIPLTPIYWDYIQTNKVKSNSGIHEVTVVLAPSKFSCTKKCAYCPTEYRIIKEINSDDEEIERFEPSQPKSYVSTEPAMMRALTYNFSIWQQIFARLNEYETLGNVDHTGAKVEMIVSGGTWDIYPLNYREEVMKEIYFGVNEYSNWKGKKYNLDEIEANLHATTLEDEIKKGETSFHRIVGITLETRPDFITKRSIGDYRRWGVTRMQIGVQHYDDEVLRINKRECTVEDTINAIYLLKQAGFKVVCHLMPDLPGSNPEKDIDMLLRNVRDPDVRCDDLKIYPTAILKNKMEGYVVKSDIEEWYEAGTYKPYSEIDINLLINVLRIFKKEVPTYCRIQRLIRDFPSRSIEAGYSKKQNLRQIIHKIMQENGEKCHCIRCMEIRDRTDLMSNAKLVVNSFVASKESEFFISYQSHKTSLSYLFYLFLYYFTIIFSFGNYRYYWQGNLKTYQAIVGFCRLRLERNSFISELKDCAIIREVHVYGKTNGVGLNINDNSQSTKTSKVQHHGFGKRLVKTAEDISRQNGFKKLAIISAVGTRQYYEKLGYKLIGTYMIKNL